MGKIVDTNCSRRCVVSLPGASHVACFVCVVQIALTSLFALDLLDLSWCGIFVHSEITGGKSVFSVRNFCDDIWVLFGGTTLLSCTCPCAREFMSFCAIM